MRESAERVLVDPKITVPSIVRPPPRAIIFAGPVAHAGIDVERALDREITVCRAHADAMRWEIVSTRREKRPAKDGLARPSIGRLIRDGIQRRYDVLLVDRIRRLGTPPSLAAEIVRQIEETGVRVVPVLPDAGPALAAAIVKFGLAP